VARGAGLEKSIACVGIPITFPGASVFCSRFFVISKIFGHVLVSSYITLKCVFKGVDWFPLHSRALAIR
jgi:hypothetical protein